MSVRAHRLSLTCVWIVVVLSFIFMKAIWLRSRYYGDTQPGWPFLEILIWPFVHILGQIGIQEGWPLYCAVFIPLPAEAAMLTLCTATGRHALGVRVAVWFHLAAFTVASLMVWHYYTT